MAYHPTMIAKHAFMSVRTKIPTWIAVFICGLTLSCARDEVAPSHEVGQERPAVNEAQTEEGGVSTSIARPAGPYVRVLGTAQDGGFPHAACNCERCELARAEPEERRHVASLALIVPQAGSGPQTEIGPQTERVYVIDATPDIREQVAMLRDVRDAPEGRVDRAPIDGVMLTHAHLGHYTGLAFFGFEAVHTSKLPVYCTPRMAEFLRNNGPWSQLIEFGNIVPVEQPPGSSFELDGGDKAAGLTVELLKVPHRDEFSDTVGFIVRGPNRSMLYVPDTDSWAQWSKPLPEVLAGVDLAILDGSFYSMDELPGRDITAVKHPLVTQSMDLLQGLVDEGATEVYFSHMNHTNPVLMPGSAARQEIERRGFHVLDDGDELAL